MSSQSCGITPSCFLARKGLFAQLVPALIELAFVLVGPLFRYVMRCMRCAGRKIHEERLIAREQSLLAYPRNRAIRHILHEVIALFGRLRRFHDFRALVNRGIPLIGLAGNETVEVFEARARRPAIEGPNGACFPHRHLMALAELRGGIAVEPKDFRQRRHRVRAHGAVARR